MSLRPDRERQALWRMIMRNASVLEVQTAIYGDCDHLRYLLSRLPRSIKNRRMRSLSLAERQDLWAALRLADTRKMEALHVTL